MLSWLLADQRAVLRVLGRLVGANTRIAFRNIVTLPGIIVPIEFVALFGRGDFVRAVAKWQRRREPAAANEFCFTTDAHGVRKFAKTLNESGHD